MDKASLGYFLSLLLLFVQGVAGQSFVNPSSDTVLSVDENTASGTSIFQAVASATNPVYNIETQTPASPAFIAVVVGSVYELRVPDLDYESHTSFEIVLKVTEDGGGTALSPTITVNVNDVNDNTPAFTTASYTTELSKSATYGTEIIQVTATDGDSTSPNNQITYSITAGNDDSFFSLDPLSGQLTLSSSTSLTLGTIFTLTLEASDGGTPSLTATASATITVVEAPAPSSSSIKQTALVAGLVIGILLSVSLVVAFLLWRKQKKDRNLLIHDSGKKIEEPVSENTSQGETGNPAKETPDTTIHKNENLTLENQSPG